MKWTIYRLNFIWYWSIFWPELDDFFIDYGQFWNLMSKLRPNCSIFWPELACFLNRKDQFFWLIHNFCLLFIDCLTRINIFFNWNGQFTVQILSDIGQFYGRNRTIFLVDYGKFFNLPSKFCLVFVNFLARIGRFFIDCGQFFSLIKICSRIVVLLLGRNLHDFWIEKFNFSGYVRLLTVICRFFDRNLHIFL